MGGSTPSASCVRTSFERIAAQPDTADPRAGWRDELPRQIGAASLALHRRLELVFDPLCVLNPGKLITAIDPLPPP